MSDLTVYTQREGLMLTSIQDKLAMAETLARSGLMPQALNTKEKVFVALQWGHELGLSPMVAVNNIAVINGKPTLGADIMHALVRSNPEYAGCEWKSMTTDKAEVVITREFKGRKETFPGYFDMTMAQKAGLTGKDVWIKYPQRMLKHRALAYALRDAFPDVLAGVYTTEEIEEVRNVTEYQEPRNVSEAPIVREEALVVCEAPDAPPHKAGQPEKRQAVLEEIARILKSVDPEGEPYFTDGEKIMERKFLRNVGPYPAGITILEERKVLWEKRLEERKNNCRSIGYEGAEQAAETEGEQDAEFALGGNG